jgi:hypothetical protein
VDEATRYMNEAWRKAILREARELEQRKHEHALGCQVCFDMLDSESCDAYQRGLAKDD